MSGDGVAIRNYQVAADALRKKINSDSELSNRFEIEYKNADMIQDNANNIQKIIEKFNEEYTNKKDRNYKYLLDRLAKGGKKRRQKKTKKSRKQRKTRKLRKTRARK
jgi:hypothetical protein